MAFFCEKTGARIAAAGVSKTVDPANGQDEVVEVDGVEQLLSDVVAPTKPTKPAKGDAKSDPAADKK